MSGTKKTKDVGEHSYKLGDIVLAKIRGYPRWPGMVVDPDQVPSGVAKERPMNKKTVFYCVRFFPAGDYSWAVSKDLSLLQKHEIEAYINEPHKRSPELLRGYEIAMDPRKWEASLEEQRALAEEAEANEEVDQLEEGDEDDDDEPKKTKTGKKRKRESEAKPRKKKEPSKKSSSVGAESKEKKGAAATKKKANKKNGVRSKATIESEDEGAEDAEGEDVPAESSKKTGPAFKKARKDKAGDDGDFSHLANDPDAIKVKEWRHKLQRAFLSKTIPKAEEMPEYDQLFSTIENHDLTIEQLSYSKLGKVMRHISQLDQTKFRIPNEEVYNIRKRADALLDRWQTLINAASEQGAAGGVNGTSAPPPAAEEQTAPVEKMTNETKVLDVVDGKAAPVNGDAAPDAKADAAPTEPPAAEDDVAMDMADD